MFTNFGPVLSPAINVWIKFKPSGKHLGQTNANAATRPPRRRLFLPFGWKKKVKIRYFGVCLNFFRLLCFGVGGFFNGFSSAAAGHWILLIIAYRDKVSPVGEWIYFVKITGVFLLIRRMKDPEAKIILIEFENLLFFFSLACYLAGINRELFIFPYRWAILQPFILEQTSSSKTLLLPQEIVPINLGRFFTILLHEKSHNNSNFDKKEEEKSKKYSIITQ